MADEVVTPDPKDEEIAKLKEQLAQAQAPAPAGAPPAFDVPTRPPSAFAKALAPQAAAPDQSLEDRIVARLLAAQGLAPGSDAGTAKEAAPVSKEDQRVLDVLARLFPTGRDAVVKQRYSVGTNLSIVEVAYTPSTGTRRDTEALVYDDGKKIFVFGAV